MTLVYQTLIDIGIPCEEKIILPTHKELRFTAWVSVICMLNKKDEYVTYDDSRLMYYGGSRSISYELTDAECTSLSNMLGIRLVRGIGGIHIQK